MAKCTVAGIYGNVLTISTPVQHSIHAFHGWFFLIHYHYSSMRLELLVIERPDCETLRKQMVF